jgi:SAM-dependent methyltransferase
LARRFPLFDSHLDLAHLYWQKLLNMGDIVVDATCGNGHDTLFLARLVLDDQKGELLAIDVQEEAIVASQQRLKEALSLEQYKRIRWLHGSHATFPSELKDVTLFVYNLGYLPGGDKNKTTQTDTTLKSIEKALELLKAGGAVSITCYPGHAEGDKEQKALLEYAQTLSPADWSVSFHQWNNRNHSPALLLIQKGQIL